MTLPYTYLEKLYFATEHFLHDPSAENEVEFNNMLFASREFEERILRQAPNQLVQEANVDPLRNDLTRQASDILVYAKENVQVILQYAKSIEKNKILGQILDDSSDGTTKWSQSFVEITLSDRLIASGEARKIGNFEFYITLKEPITLTITAFDGTQLILENISFN